MSTVALDRQQRWRSRLQDFGHHLQPPAPLLQPLKSPPSLPSIDIHPQAPSCFTPNVSPPGNSTARKIYSFPRVPPPVFIHSRSFVPLSEATQSFDREILRLDPVISQQISNLQRNSAQYNPCHSFLANRSPEIISADHPLDVFKQTVRSITKRSDSQDLTNSCKSKVNISHTSSCGTACTMHAQVSSGNLTVNVTGSSSTCHNKKGPAEDSLFKSERESVWQELGSESFNGAVTLVTKFPEIKPYSPPTSVYSYSYLPFPLIKTTNSSSVPKSLESYSCKVSATTAIALAANRQQSNNNYVSFYTSSITSGLRNACSKSDSNLCPLRSSTKSDPVDIPKESQTLTVHCYSPREGSLAVKSREESLTTEEDSSSLDSGQESSESFSRDPSLKSRKKKHVVHKQQDLLLSQETTFSPAGEILKMDVENQDVRLGVPYKKSNSKGSIGGNNHGTAFCIRRRLIDDEGYIRRAACLCVNKEETQVGLFILLIAAFLCSL
ncbi:hypothetical protein SK128_010809 [Halocaridina rubra]|uniref:Uncharacterized protein n=1 Tax=Halocaridina rubra TaxID=373956 RepID=A0AAN8XX26_HALRR